MKYQEKEPLTWENYSGNESAVNYFKDLIKSQKFPNGIIIYGKPGVGKSLISKLFIKQFACPYEKNSIGCGKCDICLGKNKDFSYLRYCVSDASKAKETINSLVIASKTNPYGFGEKKGRVFIEIDEIELVSHQTLSSLLDPLQDTNSLATWILISMNPEKFPPVLREALESRCTVIYLNPINKFKIIELLEKANVELEKAEVIAEYAEGNLRAAWSILERCENLSIEQIHDCYGITPKKVQALFSYIATANTLQLQEFINCLGVSKEVLFKSILKEICARNIQSQELLESLSLWMSSNINYPLAPLLKPHESLFKKKEVKMKSFNYSLDDVRTVKELINRCS